LDEETRRELMRKKLCFSYKDPWVPGHRCMGKGEIYYIEVAADSVVSEEEQDNGSTNSEEESAPAEEQLPRRPPTQAGAHPPIVPQPPEQANKKKPTKGGVITTFLVFPGMIPFVSEGLFNGNGQSP
jgi:hypothetical protein